jgi:hypothetical protein
MPSLTYASYNTHRTFDAIHRHRRTNAYYQHTVAAAIASLAEIFDCVDLSGSINNTAEASSYGYTARSHALVSNWSLPLESGGGSMTNPKTKPLIGGSPPPVNISMS